MGRHNPVIMLDLSLSKYKTVSVTSLGSPNLEMN